jgi:hypothetical protein
VAAAVIDVKPTALESCIQMSPIVVFILQMFAAMGLSLAPASAPPASPAPSQVSSAAPVQSNWTLDLYNESGVRYEYPYDTACTAASVVMALNLGSGATSWSPTITYEDQEAILAYERTHMTMPTWFAGSDPHGARNGLNYFGWGSMSAGVYVDESLPTFAAAAKAVVSSIARYRKPAIVFVANGGHAQLVTGYKTHGSNPATSDDFTITGIYLTDPLQGRLLYAKNGVTEDLQTIGRDQFVSLAEWHWGPMSVRFSNYWQADSIYRDPIDGNIGKAEWYGKFVAVIAARSQARPEPTRAFLGPVPGPFSLAGNQPA